MGPRLGSFPGRDFSIGRVCKSVGLRAPRLVLDNFSTGRLQNLEGLKNQFELQIRARRAKEITMLPGCAHFSSRLVRRQDGFAESGGI